LRLRARRRGRFERLVRLRARVWLDWLEALPQLERVADVLRGEPRLRAGAARGELGFRCPRERSSRRSARARRLRLARRARLPAAGPARDFLVAALGCWPPWWAQLGWLHYFMLSRRSAIYLFATLTGFARARRRRSPACSSARRACAFAPELAPHGGRAYLAARSASSRWASSSWRARDAGLNGLSSRRWARPSQEALDEALAALAGFGPDLRNGNTNHGTMAAEALCALGRHDAVLPFLERYRVELLPMPPAVERIDAASWRAALAKPERAGDWSAFFADELAEAPWRGVLDRWAGRLAPTSAAPHGDPGRPRRARAGRARIARARARARRRQVMRGVHRIAAAPTGHARACRARHAFATGRGCPNTRTRQGRQFVSCCHAPRPSRRPPKPAGPRTSATW
jgi:hypothetical protein